MSTSAVTPPPGFELERGEHLAVTPPPGFELEDQSGTDSVQLPPGFELKDQTSQDSAQMPPGFKLEQSAQSGQVRSTGVQRRPASPSWQSSPAQAVAVSPAASIKFAQPKKTVRPTQPHPATGSPIRTSGSGSDAGTLKFFNEALAKFSDSTQEPQLQPQPAATSTEPVRQRYSKEEWQLRRPSGYTPEQWERVRLGQPSDNPMFTALHEPVPHWDPLTGYPTGEVNAVKAKYAQASGRYVEWTPREREILDKLRRVDQNRMALLAIAQKYLVDPFDKLAAKGREAGETYAEMEYGQAGPRVEGVAKGVFGSVGGMVTDPRTWPFMIAGPETSAAEGFLSRAARPTLQRAAGAGFGIQTAGSAIQQAIQVRNIWNDPNIPLDQKYEAITNSVLSALLAGASASHTMHSEAPPPLEPRLVEQLNRMGEEAKQQIYLRLQDKLLPRTQEIRAGDTVTLKDGSRVTLKHVAPEMGRAVVRTRIGRAKTVALNEIQTDRADAVAIEFVLAESPHPRQKATPSAEQIYKANASAPLRPVTKEGPRWDFQRKMCGDKEFLLKGGGEKVWADGPITSEGLALDAKFVEKPAISPFIYNSRIRHDIRNMINRNLEDEFRRYAAMIGDPNTPVVGLKVLTNDRRAVPYVRDLMDKYGIPGRIVFRLKE